jgi:hypothetical protein
LFSPWIPAGVGACIFTLATVWVLNRTGASRYFRLHRWVFLAILILYGGMFFWGINLLWR